jgi:hypothetical protein
MDKETEDVLKKLTSEELVTTFDPNCIRQKSNMSLSSSKYRFDSGIFNPKILLNDIPLFSPKLEKLLKKIEELDKKDQKKHGKKFKHFIFSDLKSASYGPKLISSALIAKGHHLGYTAKMVGNPRTEDKEDQSEDDDEGQKGKGRKANIWGQMEMLSDKQLEANRGNNFYLLSSVSVYEKPISVKMRKEILSKFNERPSNINGDLARIIVMDSGFKEGIDLFDIKYVHIFEPSVNSADQKQVIGRGTRTCGQKGLDFHPTKGWPLHVFVYDLEFPQKYKSHFLNSDSAFELYMKSLNIDFRMVNFTNEIEELSVYGSVDYELNQNIHRFSIDNESDSDDDEEYLYGGKKKRFILRRNVPKLHITRKKPGFHEIRKLVDEHYREFMWEPVKMENTCVTPPEESEKKGQVEKKGGFGKAIQYTPTQDFIRHYFSPQAPVKGMLLHHSVGTGKTCSAIAAASSNFEPQGYTILWVTRTTLKNDIWKNMFSQICNESLRYRTDEIPADPKQQMRMLSKSWRIRPMSYKQFSNLVSKENNFYKRLVKENGEEDPLRKTLLIIDEAHKLYGGGDLSSIERPDMVALHQSLMHSYAVSGENSVRLLLMTATPITESPMELIQLLNLCRPINLQMPGTFDTFKDEYLNEEGRFTEKGREKYLDDIAGHISYLNREKDARQFSQPVVKRVLVPVIEESLLKKFDKGIIRTESDKAILELKAKSDEYMKEIGDEINMIKPSNFAYLKKKCDQKEIPKKECEKIVKKNIKELVDEIRLYKKSLTDQVKEIKEEQKSMKHYKQTELETIKTNIEKYPQEYEKYKKSVFFSLKSECGKTVKTNKELVEQLSEHPIIRKYNENIQKQEDYISQLKNSLKIEGDSFKIKMRELRELLKTDLSDLEKSVVKMTLRENEKNHTGTKKQITQKLNIKIEKNKKNLNKLKQKKTKIYKKVQKTLKKSLMESKKEEKKAKKEALKLREEIEDQEELIKDIKDETIKDLVEKQQVLLDKDLESAFEENKENREEKEEKKEKKEEEKREKKERKEEEKREKKERKNQTMKLKKEAAEERMKEKERKNQTMKLKKEAAEKKKEEKEREKKEKEEKKEAAEKRKEEKEREKKEKEEKKERKNQTMKLKKEAAEKKKEEKERKNQTMKLKKEEAEKRKEEKERKKKEKEAKKKEKERR